MKLKALLLFVVGLGVWLLATNYQVVYSKLISFKASNEADTAVEIIASNAQITDNEEISSQEISHENTHQEEETNTATEQVIVSDDVQDNIQAEEEAAHEDLDISGDTKEEEATEGLLAAESTAIESTIDPDPTTDDLEPTTETPKTAEATAPSSPSQNVSPMYNYNAWMPPMQSSAINSWANPMYSMMMPMMSMMGAMMNPYIYMNPMTMMNYPTTAMTHPQNMDAMMRSMNPQLMFSMFGQPSAEYKEGETPDKLPVVTIPGFPTQIYQNWPKNKVSPGVSREAKKNAFQTAMAMSPLSMRDMISIMADKVPVEEGVSWDDAVEAMKLRANEVNFKFVGSSPLWKQIEAETEQPSAKVEMFRFCDARMARKILDEVPEFIVFLPCKIALIEDGDGKLWVMTLDWDVSWLDYTQNSNSHLSKDIRENAQRIRENIHYIMEGAATGDF